ncbi:hypothetical protein Poli38472_003853 [Pythium oligandrum]|uniref:Sugar transporter SWEET1 n=1 Tax=Pythium oligandrum TaxID=41045 RepID=A0A8K1FPY7_PYTOL|nr:hypothetical protein Poli38472_003853 [Pythium oligandrum]|eukprot:TMW66088.1 hypothetical protein Poli38472_003853 [Pythium oligandrum]
MSDAFTTVIKILASLAALYMCLSPSSSMYRIHKEQTTGVMSVLPLIALFLGSHMWLLYGYVTDDLFPMVTTYVIGDITSLSFIAVYYRWSSNKRYVLKVFSLVLGFCALITLYTVLGVKGVTHQHLKDVKLIVGCFANASSILLYTSPLATVMLVLRTKSSASIPFTMVLVGLINNALWVVYGVLLHDALVIAPSCVSVFTCSIQLVLFFIYRDNAKAMLDLEQDKLPSAMIVPSDEVVLAAIQVDIEPYAELRSPRADMKVVTIAIQ